MITAFIEKGDKTGTRLAWLDRWRFHCLGIALPYRLQKVCLLAITLNRSFECCLKTPKDLKFPSSRDRGVTMGQSPLGGQFESHVANCRLTSSCGTVSSRSIWSTPLRIAARNSRRLAIVSSLASAGRRWIESKASSLSLMEILCIKETQNAIPLLHSCGREGLLVAL